MCRTPATPIKTESGDGADDVGYDDVKEVASWVTRVPGGVGPMAISMLTKSVNLWDVGATKDNFGGHRANRRIMRFDV
ncbi:bifunctional 5 [Tropilaelaps mercedesae]|uniref:Bifunctional 5 n=1 Tax=Tropilaelaps mercedesae TaxID=418985 RepID=A0A1V9XI76_9ACAR|nr:bifunctional 5 [Tropilaelaps mercedesae]